MKTKLRILQVAVSIVIYNLTIIGFSWCFKLITDSLIAKKIELFHTYICFAFFIVVIQAISNYMYISGKNKYIKNTMIKVKSSFISAIFNYEISRFQQKDISEYQSFLFNDLAMYEQKVVTGKVEICEKAVLLLFSGVAIFVINPQFLILIAILLISSIVVPALFARYAKKFNTLFSDSCTRAMEKVVEMMNGFMILRAFSIENEGVIECKEVISEMESTKNKYKKVMAVFQSMLILMTTILTLTIFVWGGRAVINRTISVGELIALTQLLFNIAGPLMGIMTAISNVKAARPIVEKYKGYINVIKYDGEEEFAFENSILFKNLSFSYGDDEKQILRDLNFKFEKNKKYAIVGENGSGKSTLLKLLAGVLDMNCYQGNILVDDTERKDLKDKSFWNNVAYIPQQVFLFKKSITDNICLNNLSSVSENFKYIIRRMDIEKLINRNKEINDTEYKELSGGEKQKIAFIREIFKKSKLILADEPDASLDPEAAGVIHEILQNLNKTCIVVTHRINSRLADYDEIVVMEKGKIVEFGNYNELMARKSYLYKMNQRAEVV